VHNWELSVLSEATQGFSDACFIGRGGCAIVYRAELPVAPAITPALAVVVKKAIYPEADHHELDCEVDLLKRCQHEHLLPLVGYCRSLEAPCLLFPLMRGGSFECRLRLGEDELASLYRLGHFTSPPKPLTWRQRLRIVLQASEALLHLHSMGCVHRDFKPANILLEVNLDAKLSDTGFAKAASTAGGGRSVMHASMTGRGSVHTTGYGDPLIVSTGEYSAKTDSYAVGITLLVCLTNRSAEGILDAIADDHDKDFDEIEPAAVVDASLGCPAHVAAALVPLVRATEREVSLCNESKRKRIDLVRVTQAIHTILEKGASTSGAATSEAATSQAATASERPTAFGAGAAVVTHSIRAWASRLGFDSARRADEAREAAVAPTAAAEGEASASQPGSSDASKLVRKLGRAAAQDEEAAKTRRLQQKASEGFRHLMDQVAHVYAARAAEAPADFIARIDFWRDACGLPAALHERLHRLRIWRNASEHGDEERWRREGARDEAQLVEVLGRCAELVERLGVGRGLA